MSYSRFWDCERCGKRQESMDWPAVAVCESCVGAAIVVTRQMQSSASIPRVCRPWLDLLR